jgi:PAS domain S-box-containing protein
VVLAGWIFNIPALVYIVPGLPKMTVNTAVGLILAAFSLFFYNKTFVAGGQPWQRQLALVLAGLVTLLGLLTMSEYIFAVDLGIDQLFIEDLAAGDQTTIPGRPSPQTAVTFILFGSSLILLYRNRPLTNRFAEIVSLATAFTPIAALVGYIYSISFFYRISIYTGMALHTALAFLILCVGCLSLGPIQGLVYLLRVKNLGGLMARRLLIAAVLVPFLAGFISLIGSQLNIFPSQIQPVFIAVMSGYAFSAVIWWYAHKLNLIETEREEAENQFRLVVETSPNAIILVNPAGKIQLVNGQAETLFQYDREELLGQPIEMLVPKAVKSIHDEYRNSYLKNPTIRPMGRGRDLHGLRKDKSQAPLYIGLSPLMVGNEIYVRASIVDITERKRAEEKIADTLEREKAAVVEVKRLNTELEERVLERTAQLESANKELEAFSYSVSHDLRAPLRSIDGFSQALLDDYSESLDEEAHHYLRRVRASSQKMAQLIDDLLMLSRLTRSEIQKQPVDLSQLACEIVDTLKQMEPEREVAIDIAPNLVVEADRRLIRVALDNLLGNAWKFTRGSKEARIEFGVKTQNDGKLAYFVQDNGAGFDMAYGEKLFDAFQRLHTVDEFPGTGIGLAIVQRVIRRHDGRIWAEGKVGKGAAFYFTLN